MTILDLKLPLKLTCIGAALAVLAFPAQAQTTLEDCVLLADPMQRLACFDGVMAARNPRPAPARDAATPAVLPPLLAAPSAAAAPPAAAPPAAPSPSAVAPVTTAATVSENFGLELRRPDKSSDAERSFRVSAARHNDFTGWTIEFEDGSIWKQIGTDRYAIEVGKTYTIRRGSLNSFQLGNPDNNRKIRVRREE